MVPFLSIAIGSILYGWLNHYISQITQKNEDKIGCLGVLGVALFLKFILPVIFLIIIFAIIIIDHDSRIP